MNPDADVPDNQSAIEETLFLLSIPGMAESIKQGMAEDLSACVKESDSWQKS